MSLSRRAALSTAALGVAASMLPVASSAALPLQGGQLPAFQRFRLGSFEVTSLLAASRMMEKPFEIFGLNVSEADHAKAAADAFLPVDVTRNFMIPVLVNTGRELVLFDTGLTPQGITAALAAAGVAPDQIDIVVITHMHGDHIGGLSGEAGPTFPSARYITGETEFAHWAAAENEGFEKHIRPLEAQFTRIGDTAEILPGITAMLAPGHTPGHMIYHLESEGRRLMLTADLTNHFAFSLPNPDWEVRYDLDKAQAAESRRRVLGLIADDRIPFIGYHMPFPGLGYVVREGQGFRFIPHSYQLMEG
uniref:MBL fold metallo-hydrolase n=1 Tax=Falsigemmobacter faecalis TaxID=2488730 RepID=UPI0038990F74